MRSQSVLIVLLALAAARCTAPASPHSQLSESEAAAARDACRFAAGTPAGLSVARTAPIGAELPIDTIVVLALENRSFDHLLQNLPAYGQPDADVALATATNPGTDGQAVARTHLGLPCVDDVFPFWSLAHRQYNGGRMDGFALTNPPNNADPRGERALGYYTEADLPFLYGLANTFALGDRHFASVLTQTFPNRAYLYAGSSFGIIRNELIFGTGKTVFEALETRRVGWRFYSEAAPGATYFIDFYGAYRDHFKPLADFYTAAAAGTLEPVVFVDPNLIGHSDDFDPPSNVQLGDQFIERVVKAVIAGPQWPHTALIVTFDEHGGFYDHVPPPPACTPDQTPPMLQAGDEPGAFDRLGIRIPLIVVSPYARPHYVSHHVYSHASILRFIEARHGLGAFSARDANAEPLYDLFDFTRPALLTPPALPAAAVDPAKAETCRLLHGAN